MSKNSPARLYALGLCCGIRASFFLARLQSTRRPCLAPLSFSFGTFNVLTSSGSMRLTETLGLLYRARQYVADGEGFVSRQKAFVERLEHS